MSALRILQGTDAWYEARRAVITSTDIPIILGLSPYKCEADLAAEKAGETVETPDAKRDRMMRLGTALEPIIRAEDEREHGWRLRHVNRFITSKALPWAATSLDFEVIGERVIVETKASRARRWEDGLPQDVEAQVRWQMGVAGYPRAHVVCLRSGSELECFDVEHDAPTFEGLVAIAADFRARLEAGGPFAQSVESLKRRYPADNGAEMVADADLTAAVRALVALRGERRTLEADEERIEAAIKARMGEFALLAGPGFHVTWKRTKDIATTDWKSVADGLLRQLPETERTALVGIATTVRQGFRPLRVVLDKEE